MFFSPIGDHLLQHNKSGEGLTCVLCLIYQTLFFSVFAVSVNWSWISVRQVNVEEYLSRTRVNNIMCTDYQLCRRTMQFM